MEYLPFKKIEIYPTKNGGKLHLLKKILPISVSLIVLIFYLLTLAKTTVSLDNGELAATSYLLGIPHPTGYPLFTIIGFLFSQIPVPFKVIQKLNFLSLIYGIISVYFTIKIIKLLLDEFELNLTSNNNSETFLSERYKIVISIFSGLVFGFSKSVWYQSTNYEVYTLNIALVTLIIFYSLKAFFDDEKNSFKSQSKQWLITFILYGLLLSHHLSSSLIIIPITFLYFFKFNISKFYNFIKYISISLLISVILYSYIPIRALMNPVVGFGKPQTIVETLEHITAKIYRPLFFQSFDQLFRNLNFFFSSLMFHFNIYDFRNSEFHLSILFIFPGLIFSLLYFRKIFYFFSGLLAIVIIFPSLYGIQDLDAYYIPAYFVITIFISTGIYSLIKFLKKKMLKKISLLIFIVIVIFQFYFNFNRVNQSKNHLMEDYFISIVKGVEPNAIVLNSSSWLHSMSLYFQLVEKIRPDVIFVNYSFAKDMWYAEQVNNLFAKEQLIQLNKNNLNLNLKNRPVYLTYEMFYKVESGEIKFSGNYLLVPSGLTFKLISKGDYVHQSNNLYDLRFDRMNFKNSEDLKMILMEMIIRRIYYELEYKQYDRARQLINKFIEKFGPQSLPKDLFSY